MLQGWGGCKAGAAESDAQALHWRAGRSSGAAARLSGEGFSMRRARVNGGRLLVWFGIITSHHIHRSGTFEDPCFAYLLASCRVHSVNTVVEIGLLVCTMLYDIYSLVL